MISTVILVVVGLFALAMIVSSDFRGKVLTTLRIRSNAALDKATTSVEREKDQFQQLLKKARDQQAKVANVMALSNSAQKDLKAKQDAVDSAKRDYKMAVDMKASEETVNNCAAKHAAAKTAVTAQEQVCTELAHAADEARKALETTRENLKKIEADISSDEAKAELTSALKTTGDTLQAAKDMNSNFSAIGEERKKIDQDLERARAGVDLARGSKADQEMDDIRKKAAAAAARAELDAEINGGPAKAN